MKKICGFALTMILALGGQAVWADDITGQDRFICSIGDVTMCNMDWECEIGSPYQFNIPDFIVFDLEAGLLKTTEASQENRQTPILSVSQAGWATRPPGTRNGTSLQLQHRRGQRGADRSSRESGTVLGRFRRLHADRRRSQRRRQVKGNEKMKFRTTHRDRADHRRRRNGHGTDRARAAEVPRSNP